MHIWYLFACPIKQLLLSIILSPINWSAKKLGLSSSKNHAFFFSELRNKPNFLITNLEFVPFFCFSFSFILHDSCNNFYHPFKLRWHSVLKALVSFVSSVLTECIECFNNKKSPFIHIQNINIYQLTTCFYMWANIIYVWPCMCWTLFFS